LSEIQSDEPPGGVAQQIKLPGVGGGPQCLSFESGDPEVIVSRPVLERTGVLSICIKGLPFDQVSIEITAPDGTDWQPLNLGSGLWLWYSDPRAPLGTYIATATDGATSASITFDVVPASERRGQVSPDGAPAGASFRIWLAGYAPEQPIALRLYRLIDDGTGANVQYVASITPVAGADGEALIDLQTSADDQPGKYYGITDPPLGQATIILAFTIEPGG
jgi:hypothetical protein